jgi:hypothetical protein
MVQLRWRKIGLIGFGFSMLIAACHAPEPSPLPAAPTAWEISPDIKTEMPTPMNKLPRFHWQLTDYPVDTTIQADFYGLDLFETSANTIAVIQARGAIVICYLNAGAWEDFRPDADQFPQVVIGKRYTGWQGERWLDIRNYEAFVLIMLARLDLALEKGCDGIEPDNIQGYQNDTGFPISAENQLAYNRWLSSEAHNRGLLIALKNNPDQARELVDDFDLAIVEDCAAHGFCEAYLPFIAQGKSVFQVEYTDNFNSASAFCLQSRELGTSAQLKRRELDVWSEHCSSSNY